jgi:hypothetical protein
MQHSGKMMKTLLPRGFQACLVLVCFVAISSFASAQDRFAVVVGAGNKLVFFGPKGERAAEINISSVAVPVTAGAATLQVSYGWGADGKLTAILTPAATDPTDLHFNVLGKNVDADKAAAVTLVFSSNLKSVSIDPGTVGRVEVNSHRLRHHAQ